jgi:hypothetical protein
LMEQLMTAEHKDGTADSAANGGSHGAEARAPGASPSNTAPHNCNWTDDLVFLRSGVDTLQLSYRGELFDETRVRLDELKRVAQSDNSSERTYAQIQIGPRAFNVLPRGSGLFRYVLTDPWFRISLSEGTGSLPVAFVQIGSEVLTKIGPKRAEEVLHGVLAEILSISEGPTIGRIDCCVDFSTGFDMETIDRRDWVTRAKRISQYVEGDTFTGWSIGLRGTIAARLYDKLEEIKVSGKDYFGKIWTECGWDGESPVWRLEFQVKRDALKQFDATRFDDAVATCAGLWPYLTNSWLRLAIPSEDDATRSRWPTHPLWEALQMIDFGSFDPPPLQRVSLTGTPSQDWMFRTGASAFLTYMAVNHIDDIEEGVFAFVNDYLDYLDQATDARGSFPEDHVDTKLREIRRRYNIGLNERPDFNRDPVADALARHYRRGKDGG